MTKRKVCPFIIRYFRSTSPTPGTSPPRGPRHSGKMSPAPPLPREHLTITPRKGPVTKEGKILNFQTKILSKNFFALFMNAFW
jgi:hypothetical protein